MESKYKVGDIVTVKKVRDGESDDYRFSFTDRMLKESGGKSMKIESVTPLSTDIEEYSKKDDGYKYKLEGSTWTWASSMFEDSSEVISLESSIDNSLDALIAKKKRPELDFTL